MKKNPPINFGLLKNFSGKLVKNLSWLFFAIFLVLLVFEFFKVQNSVAVINSINQEPPLVGVEKGIRINFENYNQVVDRIQQASIFRPTDGITKNPFAVPLGPPTQ